MRESLHVDALKLWSSGQLNAAAEVWERILAMFPADLLAIKCTHDTYFYLGQSQNICSSIERGTARSFSLCLSISPSLFLTLVSSVSLVGGALTNPTTSRLYERLLLVRP
jgi:hypothetical protein